VQAEGAGGYARELTDEEKRKQAEVLAKHIAAASAVITTASLPGRDAPKIITRAMVEGMKPGSVIVDLAAETGGNCELTEPGKTIEHNDVIIYGPVNIPSLIPVHATETYGQESVQLPLADVQGRSAGPELGRRGYPRERTDSRG